jgi:hypothetical protein
MSTVETPRTPLSEEKRKRRAELVRSLMESLKRELALDGPEQQIRSLASQLLSHREGMRRFILATFTARVGESEAHNVTGTLLAFDAELAPVAWQAAEVLNIDQVAGKAKEISDLLERANAHC